MKPSLRRWSGTKKTQIGGDKVLGESASIMPFGVANCGWPWGGTDDLSTPSFANLLDGTAGRGREVALNYPLSREVSAI